MFGFLNVYKPKGKTSHDVVAILRRITKIKQIGHTGTLDPFAEGVLPVCIGKATRLIEYLEDDKAYKGVVKFGASTDTYDVEGKVTACSDKIITKEELEEELDNFRGKIKQYPPIYSAIKLNGKKLYEYARNGENVEVKPRKICVNRLELLRFDYENQIAELYIECSKGTYIRSIANDLGSNLGCYAHLIALERVKAGKFLVENSIKLENLITNETVLENIIYPTKYLNYPVYKLNSSEMEFVSHGNSLNVNLNDGLYLLVFNEELIAVAEANNNALKCKKVFV